MIGVFDSGFGGLDVLFGLIKTMPDFDYVYFGDNANAPYGDKRSDEIFELAKNAIDILVENGCTLIIAACNTVSANSVQRLNTEYIAIKYPEVVLIGIIAPVAEEAMRKTANGRIGVMATRSTVNSKSFQKVIEKQDPYLQTYELACPKLAPAIEALEDGLGEVREAIQEYVPYLLRKGVDTIILGCTHYGLVLDEIMATAGFNVEIVSAREPVSRYVKKYLEDNQAIKSKLTKGGTALFYTSGSVEKFDRFASKVFNAQINASHTSSLQ